jgi:hypothetical protein
VLLVPSTLASSLPLSQLNGGRRRSKYMTRIFLVTNTTAHRRLSFLQLATWLTYIIYRTQGAGGFIGALTPNPLMPTRPRSPRSARCSHKRMTRPSMYAWQLRLHALTNSCKLTTYRLARTPTCKFGETRLRLTRAFIGVSVCACL